MSNPDTAPLETSGSCCRLPFRAFSPALRFSTASKASAALAGQQRQLRVGVLNLALRGRGKSPAHRIDAGVELIGLHVWNPLQPAQIDELHREANKT